MSTQMMVPIQTKEKAKTIPVVSHIITDEDTGISMVIIINF